MGFLIGRTVPQRRNLQTRLPHDGPDRVFHRAVVLLVVCVSIVGIAALRALPNIDVRAAVPRRSPEAELGREEAAAAWYPARQLGHAGIAKIAEGNRRDIRVGRERVFVQRGVPTH